MCHVAVDGQEKDGSHQATMIPMGLSRARKREKGNISKSVLETSCVTNT